MTNKTISALTAASTPVTGTETLPISQGGATVKATIAQLGPGLAGIPAAAVTGTALVSAAIGTTVQAYDADLVTWAGITPGTGVGTALAINVGTAGSFITNGGALGTPSSGSVTNLTGTASININGTVGATTPTTGVFTTLSASGGGAFGQTTVAVNGTGSQVRVGNVASSAITSTLDLFVAYMESGNPLNPANVNGCLLIAPRNTGGAEVVITAENAVVARASSSGYRVIKGVGVGNTAPQASGIAFPATAVAVADANTLDDYEEGTWTPNQGAGLILVGAFSSSGGYTKIGRQVAISGTVSGATSVALSAAGVITSNLPFTVGTAGHGNVTNAAISSFAAVICTSTSVTSAGAISATGVLTFSATYFV